MLGTFRDRTQVAEVTDDEVKSWIKYRSRCSTDDMAGHVKDAIKRVKFKPDRSDPQGASLQFFADVMTELRRNRVDHVIQDASKALISQLMTKLEPSIVRETVAAAHDYWPKEKKYDFCHFIEKVMEISVESAKYSQKRHREDGHQDKDSGHSKHKKQKNQKGRSSDRSAPGQGKNKEPTSSL